MPPNAIKLGCQMIPVARQSGWESVLTLIVAPQIPAILCTCRTASAGNSSCAARMPTVDVGAEDLPGLYVRDRRVLSERVTLASAPVAHCPTMLF
jgi:hypothetical protein